MACFVDLELLFLVLCDGLGAGGEVSCLVVFCFVLSTSAALDAS